MRGVQYNSGAQLDPSQMGGGGSGRRGGAVAVGGGASILVIIVALFVGFDPSALLGVVSGTPTQTTTSTSSDYANGQTGADISANPECRYVAYTNSIQSYWQQALPGYQVTKTVTFTGTINTGCGQASADVGPFYCPADQLVYLDTSFFATQLPQLGAQGGDAAEAYVIAHEYGHHISNLTGQMSEARSSGNDTGPKSAQVRLELQADCYAGVFFANTIKDQNSPIESVTQEDLDRIVEAARAVGDDHIQQQSGGRVVPESWTHGSSQMRQYWTATGFQSGEPSSCDTFSTDDLGG